MQGNWVPETGWQVTRKEVMATMLKDAKAQGYRTDDDS
jgi:hypothetical protein